MENYWKTCSSNNFKKHSSRKSKTRKKINKLRCAIMHPNGRKQNEFQTRLKRHTGTVSARANVRIRFRSPLLQHRLHIQDRHNNHNIQHNPPNNRSRSSIKTTKREKTVKNHFKIAFPQSI